MVGLFELVLTLVFVFIAAYFLKSGSKRKAVNNELLLYGLSNSKKTRLFYKLLCNKLTDTTTSFTVNKAEFERREQMFSLLDFPGASAFDAELKSILKAGSTILFSIDSSKKYTN